MQRIDIFNLLLQRYVTKGIDPKKQQFSEFSWKQKNPVKHSACVVSQKIAIGCIPFSSPGAEPTILGIESSGLTRSSEYVPSASIRFVFSTNQTCQI